MDSHKLALMRPPATARRAHAYIVVGNDRIARVIAATEHMQPVVRRQGLADLDAPHAVAVGVESRRIAAKSQSCRKRPQNSAPDTAFRGTSDSLDRVSGVIGHTRGGHPGVLPP